MPEELTANGTATPLSTKMTGLALTEYTATPTPPSERAGRIVPGLSPKWNVPEEFFLPNGYPDVRMPSWLSTSPDTDSPPSWIVSPPDFDVTGLRCH